MPVRELRPRIGVLAVVAPAVVAELAGGRAVVAKVDVVANYR